MERHNSREPRSLLRERDREDYAESVATTWTISFQKVKHRNPAAAELLLCCAFLSPDEIPEEVLVQGRKFLGRTLSHLAADAHKLNLAIKDLKAYSLIERHPRRKMLSLHRLVQEVVRDSLSASQHTTWVRRVFEALEGIFPDPMVDSAHPHGDLDHWPLCDRLVPQVLLCAQQAERASVTPERIARLLNKTGLYLQNRGRSGQVGRYYEYAYERCVKWFGSDHPLTACVLNNLADLSRDQGKYGEAEELLQQVKRVGEQKGAPAWFLAQTLGQLAALSHVQGRYLDAEPLYQEALQISQQHSGPRHLRTAQALNNLASVYCDQGRYRRAEQLYQRSLKIREDRFGPHHPVVGGVLNNLAILYRYQGNYERAESWQLSALALRRKLLGEQHPETMESQSHLGRLYCCQGRYKEAEDVFDRVFAIRTELYGPRDPKTAESLNDRATAYWLQGRYAEAEPLYQQALAIRERRLGPEHPETARSLHDLATLYRDQGRYAEAEVWYQYALAIYQKLYDGQDLKTAESLNGLATLYGLQGKLAEAESRYQQALRIRGFLHIPPRRCTRLRI